MALRVYHQALGFIPLSRRFFTSRSFSCPTEEQEGRMAPREPALSANFLVAMRSHTRSHKIKMALWLAWFLALEVAAFLVPYTLLRNVERLWGAFLFWNVFAVLAIISLFLLTRGWRE